MDKVNKQELRRLAEEATPGEWGYDGSYVCTSRNEDGTVYVESWNPVSDCLLTKNAKYIAAANPAAILSLLDELEQAEERIRLAEVAADIRVNDAVGRAIAEHGATLAELERYRKVTAPFANYMAARGTARGLQMSISGGDLCAELTESDWFALGAMAKEGGANG